MLDSKPDHRTPARRERDEQIANEPKLPFPNLSQDASVAPVEAYLAARTQRPIAVRGIVENGVVRPVDPAVKLTEHARVIIVAAE